MIFCPYSVPPAEEGQIHVKPQRYEQTLVLCCHKVLQWHERNKKFLAFAARDGEVCSDFGFKRNTVFPKPMRVAAPEIVAQEVSLVPNPSPCWQAVMLTRPVPVLRSKDLPLKHAALLIPGGKGGKQVLEDGQQAMMASNLLAKQKTVIVLCHVLSAASLALLHSVR